jgi:tetratricopeptide (TPR) repeat protein
MLSRYLRADAMMRCNLMEEAEGELHIVQRSKSRIAKWELSLAFARLYDAWGKFDLAEPYWKDACRAKNSPGWIYIYRGCNFGRQGKFKEAIRCFNKACVLDDCAKDEAYLNLGYTLRTVGRYDEAEKAFRKALRLTANYVKAREALEEMEQLSEALKEANALLTRQVSL